MTLEVGKRGRGSGPPGGGRGGGRGVRDGGRGVSRGFRGGDARGRGGRGRGDRGGRGFSRGGDRGGRGFSRGGDRGGRGFSRGGDRGGRGSSRGGDRGSFRGTFRGGRGAPARGAFVGAKRDFNGSSVARSKTLTPICHEIAHALQLRINYKSGIPTEEEVSKQLPGFHSRFQKATDSKDYFLLFKDIESLEAAKALLEKDDTVQKVDYMGLRAEQYQPESLGNRQAFVQFLTDQDLEAVKKLDDKIMSVKFMKSKSSCLVEFPTSEEAYQFIKKTTLSKDRGSLKYCMETTVMQTVNTAKASIQPNQIVLRDVPRKVTIKELAELFPDANSATVYTKTFPSSDYCHAALHFDDTERVKALLTDNPNTEILGKKIYFAPAYSCLLREMPKLGEPFSEYESPKKKDSEGSPKKKIKLEKDVNGGNEEEDEDEEGEGEDIEGEDIEGEDIEGEDIEGEDEEGEDEEGEDEEGEDEENEGEEDEDEGEDENGKDDNEEEMESDEDDE